MIVLNEQTLNISSFIIHPYLNLLMQKSYSSRFRKSCGLFLFFLPFTFALAAQQLPVQEQRPVFGKSNPAKKNKSGLEKVPADLLLLKQEFSAFQATKSNARAQQQTLPF